MSRWTQSELGEAMDRRPRLGPSQASRSSQSSSEAEPGKSTSSRVSVTGISKCGN